MKRKNPFSAFLKFPFSVFRTSTFKSIADGKATIDCFFPELRSILRWGIACIAMLQFSLVSLGQKTWDGGGDGINWSSANNWNPNGVPLNTDNVTITRNGTFIVNLDGNFACANLTLNYSGNTNGTISLNFLGSNSLTVSNSVSLINAATDGGSNILLAVANGTLSCGSIISTESASSTSDISLTIQNGRVTCTGNLTTGTTADRNNIIISGNGILNIGGNFSTNGTFAAGSGTVNYDGAGNQSIAALTYYNLASSTGGIKTLPDADVSINGTLDISNSTLAFTTTQARVLNVGGALSGNGIIDMSSGSRAHTLNLGGIGNDIGALTTDPASASIINYDRIGSQTVFPSPNYRDLTISGGGTKTLQGNTIIGGTLTLTSGVLTLDNNNLTLANTISIGGAPFSITNMIETNSNGRLIRSANATNESFNLTYPVGSGGYYSPFIITGLPVAAAAARVISVGAVPLNLGVLPNSIDKYWDLSATNLTTDAGTILSFDYNAGEVVGDPLILRPFTNTSGSWAFATGASAPGTNPATSTGSSTISGFWTVGANGTFYSYQTGNWNQASTWTFDPGGTTGPGISVPGSNDKVVILSGRTVSLSSDVTDQNIDLRINGGGILDQSTFRFTNSLAALRGDGVFKLASSNFPATVLNSFVTVDGGTTEYNNSGSMSATQSIYYHLIIRSGGAVVQVNNITLNGNLNVKQGTFQINDVTPRRLQLVVNGDVTVDNTGSIAVGTGLTRSNPGPLPSITGNTGSYLNYYELNSHRIQIYGDFTNNGIVRFSNLTNPVYNAFPANGFATVYFQGLSDKALSCNGQTDFYNLVVDKGTDQTFKLTVSSSAYNNFRLYGANTSDGSITLPASPPDNPNLKKALWVKNGTMVLQGLVVIPSLSEGATGGAYPSDFFIPANGAIVLDGAGVIVLSTADDFSEVNAAYGISGGSNAAYGINTSGGNSGLSILGKLQINNGYLSTRESSGLLYWNYASGQFILNGGKVDTKQFHNPEGAAAGLISYSQTGGNLIVRGRFSNTVSYINPADLGNAVINTARVNNSIDPAAGIGSFSINNNAANSYSMSGGTLSVYDVCNNNATPLAFLVNCIPSNINITGGSVLIIPTTGTLLPDANYLINSTAPFNNLSVNRVSGATSVQLNTNPLVILKDLTLISGSLIANNLDVTLGGNFSISSGATYTTGTNTTLFNGTGDQFFTVNLAAPLSLNKLSIDKTAGVALNFAGLQPVINVASDFRLVLGAMNDNGNTINIAGNVFNSGTHAGAGKIVLNGTLTQIIDGNGIFGNLELNNANAAPAPISLAANITLNGLLTFSQDKLFDIKTYNLKLNSSASILNGGPLRYVKSAGNVGDGGLTKVYSSPAIFDFPVGVINYTPGAIGLSAAPVVYGSVTMIPVNFEHPNVTTTGRSLTYFWRVKSSGFILGGATVTHGYTYNQINVVTGPGITEDGYVAARFNISTNAWTTGTTADVDEINNIIGEPGAGSFLKNVVFIDGDYTAGDDNPVSPFGAPTIYYSRINGAAPGSGLWSSINTWSTDPVLQHTGAPAGSVPGGSDIVIIGGRDSVYLATNNTIPNTDARNCASLQIEKGSALDIGYNFNSSFGMVLNHPNGNGNFRLTTSWNSGSTYTFPSGDFTDFNVNLGTTELYSTNPAAGTTYWLPNGVVSYGNLILSPLGGSNIIFPNNSLIIYGNLITRGQNADSWFCPTWNVNYPTPPNPVVAKTITVNGDLDIQGGSLIWYGNGAIAQNIVVNRNVKVATLSALYVWGSATNQSMAIGGDLINNTDGLTHGLLTTSKVDFTDIPLTFFGATSSSISNTAGTPLTVLGSVTINKGSSQATTLTIDISGTLTTPSDNWLTLQNGTLRYMRANPNSDFTISTTTPFTIPAVSGLLVNLQGNSGNRNILIGNAINTTGDLLLSGKLTLVSGNIYVGPTPSTASANDIEYSSSGASAIDVQGGSLVVNGQIRRNPLNSGAILKYSQSGGTVTVNGQSSNATNAKLEVLNGGSDFTMSNGTLTIVRGNGGITTPSSPFGDLYLRPETSTVTGGTVIFSQGALTTQNYFIDANVPLNNLTITGAAGQPAALRLLTSPLVLNGNMTINTNSVLNSNNINITFNGNLINAPGTGGYVPGTNITTFSATNGSPFAGAQSVTGATDFYDLVVNPGTSLTLNNPSIVNHNLTLSSGTFTLGGNAVSLKGNLQNDASYTDIDAAGNGLILNGTTLQQISGNGAYSRLTLNNVAGASIENNITLQEDLTMSQGIFDVKKNLLSLGVNSLIQGAPFSATKMITSDGVFSDVGLRKFFNPGVITFLYPIGTSGKYTPALLTATASNSVGFVRINNINSTHPAIIDPSNALNYYWEVQSSGMTGFSGSLILNYLQGDVVGDENNYLAARVMVPGSAWSKTLGVDPGANTITFNYITSNNLSGEYTAGISTAFQGNVPIYTSNADGNWTNTAIWTQTGGDPYPVPAGGPNGFIVIIDHEVALDANFCSAYRTTINAKLKVVSSFYGHNLGTVDGSGTLYLENGSFPAGVFNTFLSCANNGTIEYGGNGTYTIIADLYDNIPNVIFSGTGTRVLPDKDLTICNQLIINGPILDNSVYNKKLIIQGSMSRLSGTFKSGTGAGATVSFAGSGAQTIGGISGDFTGVNSFNNFEINNSSGVRINDGGAIDVNGNLLLVNGLINTGSNRKLTLTNSAINCVFPSGGSALSFVDGPLIKKISQYDNFLFPIGINIAGTGSILGNRLRLTSTQSGPLLWSAEYKNPNSTSNSITAPLLGVSAMEYYNVSTIAGSQAILNLSWVPTSDITPLITGGLSNIRLAHFNTGSGQWEEIPTSSTGNNSNGTASSISLVTYTNSGDYTLGSITSLKPRAKLSPTGAVCGAAGIPVSFTAPFVIPLNYALSYTIDGTAQVPVIVTSVPYTLPTPVPGVYKLTDFTYNNGALIGVVDASSVSVYAVPTTSNGGLDQTLCGITTAILTGNIPVVGTGLWSIVSGSGGTLIAPANPSGQFIGLNGVSYTLKWTISNGTCTSSDDVNINFTILPDPPAASASQSFCGPRTVANLVAIPPTGCTIDWYSAASGGILLPGGTALVTGTVYYAESNGGGGCKSLTRTPVGVTINSIPVPGLVGPNSVCIGSTGNLYTTEAGKSNYIWSVVGGFITTGGLGTDNTATVTWNTLGPQTISVNYSDVGGCSAPAPTLYNVTVTTVNTVVITSAPGTDAQTVCNGNAIINITYATTGATGATVTGLPAGVTGNWAANVVTISGTPAASGSFTYTVTLTGGCGVVTTTGAMTVPSNNTIVRISPAGTDAQIVCNNTAIINITYSTTGATGATVTGLPAGVNGIWLANVVTIIGTPTVSGLFTYTVTPTGGCGVVTATGTLIINSLPAPIFTVQPAANSCINTDVTYTTQPGQSNYLWTLPGVSGTDYTITSGGTVSDNTVTLKWLNPGSKTAGINYTDANGCTAILSTFSTPTIVNALPTIADAGPDQTGASLCGLTTTTLAANTPLVGTGLWSIVGGPGGILTAPGSPTSTFSGVTGATYVLRWTISSGPCTVSTDDINVTFNQNPTIANAGIDQSGALMCGLTITALSANTPVIGTGTWSIVSGAGGNIAAPNSPTSTFTGTAGTTYVLSWTIINGLCTASSDDVNITFEVIPMVNINNPSAVCAPSTADLTSAAVTAGSTAGLSYTYWTDLAATIVYSTPAAATAGTYYIKGSDPVTGCSDIKPVVVTVNSSLSVTTTQVNVSCRGGTTGTATAIASGGTGVYTYSWNTIPVQTSVTATGLSAGTYIVTVADGGSCTATASTTITEPATALSGSTTSQKIVSVPGGNDGSVTVTGSGGTPPYQYKIGSGVYQVSGTFGTLPAGFYTVTVQDLNLCTFDVPVTITQPSATLSAIISSQTNIACLGTSTGSVTITGTGGVIPYLYSLNAGPYQSSGTFGTLVAGTYTVTIRDSVLSVFDVTFTITQPASTVGGSVISQTDVLCYGSSTGSVSVSGSGGTSPYQYKLGAGSYQVSGTFGSLAAGAYTITVQDANLCTFDIAVNILQTPAPLALININAVNITCSGSANGSITVTASGGTSPYTFNLNGGTFQSAGTFSNLAAAAYTIAVKDANLCTASVSVTVSEPAPISIASTTVEASCPGVQDGSITLTITGGIQPYKVIWGDGTNTQDRQDVSDGTYSVVVTDANGCVSPLDVVVGFAGSEQCLEIPDVITPNNDGYNDTWKIKNIDLFPNAEVFVYTRWGKLVFNTKNLAANPWDGTYKGKLLPTDSYHYVLDLNDGSKVRSGVISIIR